jgi:hypothetical protein
VPPLDGVVPALYAVVPVPGTQLIHLAVVGGAAPMGLVLSREEALAMAGELRRVVGPRGRAAGRARPPRRVRPERALESRG